MYTVITFTKINDSIIFADPHKAQEFIEQLPKKDLRNGNITISRFEKQERRMSYVRIRNRKHQDQ